MDYVCVCFLADLAQHILTIILLNSVFRTLAHTHRPTDQQTMLMVQIINGEYA